MTAGRIQQTVDDLVCSLDDNRLRSFQREALAAAQLLAVLTTEYRRLERRIRRSPVVDGFSDEDKDAAVDAFMARAGCVPALLQPVLNSDAELRRLRRDAGRHRASYPRGAMVAMWRRNGAVIYNSDEWRLEYRCSVNCSCTGPGCQHPGCRGRVHDLLDRAERLMWRVSPLDEGGGDAAFLRLHARRCEEAAEMLDDSEFDTVHAAERAVSEGAERLLEHLLAAEAEVAEGAERFLQEPPSP